MKSIEPDVLAEVNAAYRLGRDRFTLRMWQELAWTWDVSDENVIQSVDISLVDLLHWLDQLKDVIDLLAAIDIKQWVERFLHKWSAYCGSEEHSHDVPDGIVVPTDNLLARNPFHHDLQDLLRITDKADLLASGRSDLRRWFTVGSIVGRSEYLTWVGSPVADDALVLLSRDEDVPAEIRQEAEHVCSLAPAMRLNSLLKLHQAAVSLIQGGAGEIDSSDYVLVVVTEPETVYFEGKLITTRLDPHEHRLIKAYADHAGQPLSWSDLATLIESETSDENLRRYVIRLLSKIAKDLCAPNEYASFRKRLKDEVFPTEENSGYYRLNVKPNQVLVAEMLDGQS